MDQNVGRLVDTIFAVIIFIFAMALMLLYGDHAVDKKVSELTVSFVNECCQTGKVSEANYQMFASKVASLGNYEIKMEHKSKKIFPDNINNTAIAYDGNYNKQILGVLYNDYGPTGQDYQMKAGDHFTLSIKKGNSEFAALWNYLTFNSFQKLSVIDYGNIVGET